MSQKSWLDKDCFENPISSTSDIRKSIVKTTYKPREFRKTKTRENLWTRKQETCSEFPLIEILSIKRLLRSQCPGSLKIFMFGYCLTRSGYFRWPKDILTQKTSAWLIGHFHYSFLYWLTLWQFKSISELWTFFLFPCQSAKLFWKKTTIVIFGLELLEAIAFLCRIYTGFVRFYNRHGYHLMLSNSLFSDTSTPSLIGLVCFFLLSHCQNTGWGTHTFLFWKYLFM